MSADNRAGRSDITHGARKEQFVPARGLHCGLGMEDLVSRIHAQQLVAAALYLGTKAVDRVLQRHLASRNYVELRADGVPHSREMVQQLQILAGDAFRRALRDHPAAIIPTADPSGKGYKLRLVLQPGRPPLQPYELTDLQVAWQRGVARELGLIGNRPTNDVIQQRQVALQEAILDLQRVHHQLLKARSPELQQELAGAMNRVQMAQDSLREALRLASPVRSDRRIHSDTLTFRIQTNGADHDVPLVQRDGALRQLLARAAALKDPSELRISTRPSPSDGPNAALVRVAFNFRNSPLRGPQHINPASLSAAIAQYATKVPAVAVQVGEKVVRVAIEAIQTVQRPAREALQRMPHSLEPPRVLQTPTLGRER